MFEINIKVSTQDLDQLNHVNNVRYVQWVQEIAALHWNTKAPTDMIKKWVWVVTRHCIEYHKAAVLGDKLKLKTYIKNSSGAMATRVVKFYLNDLEIPIVVSETDWCLLDSFSFKPKRIPLNVSEVFL